MGAAKKVIKISSKSTKSVQRSVMNRLIKLYNVSPSGAVRMVQEAYWAERDKLPKSPSHAQLARVEVLRKSMTIVHAEYRAWVEKNK